MPTADIVIHSQHQQWTIILLPVQGKTPGIFSIIDSSHPGTPYNVILYGEGSYVIIVHDHAVHKLHNYNYVVTLCALPSARLKFDIVVLINYYYA